MSGIKRMTFGEKLDKPGIPKFKGTKEVPAIVSVVNRDDALEARTHYEEGRGLGTFFCFDGECCVNNGFAKPKCVLPIIQYQITDLTTYAHGAPTSMKYLALSEEQYKALLQKESIACRPGQTLADFDIVITTKNDTYQNFEFDILVNQPPMWRTDPVLLREVTKEYNEKYVKLIERSLAKHITLEEYRKARAAEQGSAPQGSAVPAPPTPPAPPVPPTGPMIGFTPAPAVGFTPTLTNAAPAEIVESNVKISDLMDDPGAARPVAVAVPVTPVAPVAAMTIPPVAAEAPFIPVPVATTGSNGLEG